MKKFKLGISKYQSSVCKYRISCGTYYVHFISVKKEVKKRSDFISRLLIKNKKRLSMNYFQFISVKKKFEKKKDFCVVIIRFKIYKNWSKIEIVHNKTL